MSEWGDTLLGVLGDSSLRMLFIAASISAILVTGRVRSSSMQHAAWTAVLCAMLPMPLLPYVVPTITVPWRVTTPSRIETQAEQHPFELPPIPEMFSKGIPASAPIVTTPLLEVNDQPRRPDGHLVWPTALALLYCCGLVVFLLRMVLGWRALRQVLNARQRLAFPGVPPIYESGVVATPMTVEVWSPKIVLPLSWRTWPRWKLRAVLAHEIAHIRRRDSFVGLLSRVNCCLFWFNPLAWWLKGRLAATAELACDEAAIAVVGQPNRYAEMLVDVAESVRRSGGRLAWGGIGVDGGLLGKRIDTILHQGTTRKVSTMRKAIVAGCCTVVIVTVIACRQQSSPTDEEKTTEADIAMRSAYVGIHDTALLGSLIDARHMTFQRASEIESRVTNNPEDIAARKELLFFYRSRIDRNEIDDPKAFISARRQHVLWFIDNRADDPFSGLPPMRISPTDTDALPDPAGYAEAKTHWLKQTEKRNVAPQVVSNAAYFFELADRQLAEQLLVRAGLTYQLARVYSLALRGITNLKEWPLRHDMRGETSTEAEAHSEFSGVIRRKLTLSVDDSLLVAVGRSLAYYPLYGVGDTRRPEYLNEVSAFGVGLIELAVQVNPSSESAQFWLQSQRSALRQMRIRQLPKDGKYEVVSRLAERDRFELLLELANYRSWSVQPWNLQNGGTRLRAALDQSRKYAADLVALAPRFRSHVDFGNAIFNGNVMLAFAAYERGDRPGALNYLRRAAEAPVSRVTDLKSPWPQLCGKLIEDGQREAVTEFLERAAQMSLLRRNNLLAAATQLRNGKNLDIQNLGGSFGGVYFAQ